ncbi:hypothetical protein ACFIOY_00245 [Bradyrhizobium sp. TZ2]
MSTEYRPVSAIQFNSIDNRLEKYGIKVEVSDHTTALSGAMVLFAEPQGESTHFERKLGVDTRWDRFSNRPSYSPADQWVVIEGPLSHDVDFTIRWLKAARKAGLRRDRLAWDDPEADELWEKCCSYNPLYESLDYRPDLDFATAALLFVGEWLTNGASVVLNVSGSRWLENCCAMLCAGFFVQTGDRYQM